VRFDPSQTYVHLTASGAAERLPGGERFWSQPQAELDRVAHGWLITEFEFSSDWPNWEMHPEAEEFVCLLSGAAVLPVDGKANAELIALVAEQFGCSRSCVSVISGATARLKLARISGTSTVHANGAA